VDSDTNPVRIISLAGRTGQAIGLRRWLLWTAFGAALVFAGCGAEPDKLPTPDPPPTAIPTADIPAPAPTATPAPSPIANTPVPAPDDTGREQAGLLTTDELSNALFQILYDPVEPSGDPAGPSISRGLTAIGLSGDINLAPYVIDMMGVTPYGIFYRQHGGDVLRRLTGERYANDWFSWVSWVSQHRELEPGPAYFAWKRTLLSLVDPRFALFFPDGVASIVRPEEIVWGGVAAMDGIPALNDPEFVPAVEAEYLEPEEPVFGISINGDSRAYPLRIMNLHEMANDTVGGTPVALAYCTLCNSAILYDRRVGGETRIFGSSGLLFRSNKLMFDQSTRSLWNQFTGIPVLGALVGEGIRLEILSVVRTTWAEWKREHPETTVLSLQTGFERVYLEPGTEGAIYADYFASPFLIFPTHLPDASQPLPAKAEVFLLAIDGEANDAKAYPLEIVSQLGVISDTVGDRPVVVIRDDGGGVRAYARPSEVEFVRVTGSGPTARLVDESGDEWEIHASKLTPDGGGAELARLPGHVAYWFAVAAFRPDTAVFGVPSVR
jgi:hypothetical protein